jgi:hypothetical protein
MSPWNILGDEKQEKEEGRRVTAYDIVQDWMFVCSKGCHSFRIALFYKILFLDSGNHSLLSDHMA